MLPPIMSYHGLSSPFLFNLFYEEMIHALNSDNSGIRIGADRYNAFCYADDILLTSVTVTGLQRLICIANEYITGHGLRFNPKKTTCAVFGKENLADSPSWTLNGEELVNSQSLKYLGVDLIPGQHVEQRIKACRRAYHSLESTGLHPRGLSPETMQHLWNAAVRPVLTYGSHCISLNRQQLDSLEKTQSSLIKRALGLPSSSHNTHLLHALRTQTVETSRQLMSLNTFKSAMSSSSQSSHFYSHVLSDAITNRNIDKRGLTHRVMSLCQLHDVSVIRFLFDKSVSFKFLKHFPDDGINK